VPLALAGLLWTSGDAWWPATLILFGPRWLLALPLVLAILVAAARRRWGTLLGLAAAGGLTAWLLLGVCAPLGLPGVGTSDAVRVLTLNVCDDYVDGAGLLGLIDHEEPDVILLQEYLDDPPLSELQSRGYEVSRHEFLATASRYPIVTASVFNVSQETVLLRTTLRVRGSPVDVINIHLPSPTDGISAVLRDPTWRNSAGVATLERITNRRRQESRVARQWIDELSGPCWIGGDLNLTVESTIYRRDWGDLANSFSQAGRGLGWTRVLSWGDVAELADIESWPDGWTWLKRVSCFGARIDHMLTTADWRAVSARVGPPLRSDHRALLVELAEVAAGDGEVASRSPVMRP
jgi:endonuclease/exonuclease/phosphatase (EEP) superfamily protein YafD